MDFFFEPKGVAVIGATPDRFGGGRHILNNLILGYDGPIYPINPKYKEILDKKCYPSILDVPDPIDLALIFIPARAVPAVLEQCVSRGVKGAIIESSGFAEIGPEGKALQDYCLSIARKGGLRLWGPNCMGLFDPLRKYIFSFIIPESWEEGILYPGGVSLIVQSGLLSAGFITTLMGNKTLGLAKACSIGNKCDVDETELLEYFLKDPATKVIAMYLESIPRGREFFELARASQKPIVVLKGGKSPSGAQASVSHTGSLAGNYEVARGALDQAGIYQADDFFEMADMARCLEKGFPLPRSLNRKPQIAVLTYSGGAGIVNSDHLEKYGLPLAELSAGTREKIEAISPPWMPIKNPVDFYPAMEQVGQRQAYQVALAALNEDPQVDGIIVHIFPGTGDRTMNLSKMLSDIPESGPKKPILFWVIGTGKGYENARLFLEDAGYPVYFEIHRLTRIMANLFEHGPQETFSALPILPEIPDSLKERVKKRAGKGPAVLDEQESKEWLKMAGLEVVEEKSADGLDEILSAAKDLGYPVVLKGIQEGKVHKTESGLVELNLNTPDQIVSAFRRMAAGEHRPPSFLVQPMLKGDLELIAGIIRDPQFGPTVMLGLGGIRAEIYKDVVFRLAPLEQADVYQMVSKLKGQALFRGFRGASAVDLGLLAQWLIRLGEMALSFEQIREIDVNPLLIVKGKPIAVDASIILT
ncbi:MAG: acetate--CoA ligase family protein [Deltaproteobacteria bacterium]|nr:acetate--CoA ligase family protein [Deltaproteobacteria bacterium]